MKAQLAAARDARLYVADGQHHSDLIERPSAGAIEAARAFAEDIRTGHNATADSLTEIH